MVQLYVGFDNSRLDRPHKLLRGFRRVRLRPGEEKEIRISCPLEKLKYYDTRTKSFALEHMEYPVYIGTSADEKNLLRGTVIL